MIKRKNYKLLSGFVVVPVRYSVTLHRVIFVKTSLTDLSKLHKFCAGTSQALSL